MVVIVIRVVAVDVVGFIVRVVAVDVVAIILRGVGAVVVFVVGVVVVGEVRVEAHFPLESGAGASEGRRPRGMSSATPAGSRIVRVIPFPSVSFPLRLLPSPLPPFLLPSSAFLLSSSPSPASFSPLVSLALFSSSLQLFMFVYLVLNLFCFSALDFKNKNRRNNIRACKRQTKKVLFTYFPLFIFLPAAHL